MDIQMVLAIVLGMVALFMVPCIYAHLFIADLRLGSRVGGLQFWTWRNMGGSYYVRKETR